MAFSGRGRYALGLLIVMLVLVGVVLPWTGSGTVRAEGGVPAGAEGDILAAADQARAGRLVPAQQLAPSNVTAAELCTAHPDCPSPPSGLDYCVEREKLCVYYTTDSISDTQAEWAADIVEMYWARFVSLDFDEPKHDGKLEVHLSNITGDCNGGTSWSSNAISTYAGCFVNDELAQKVLGHELTHRVQYNHDDGGTAPVQTKFLKEGTARATEDNWFTEIDHWAAALSYSSFNTEVNNYLVAAINDITSYAMRYRSCLWWKYAMEQYGTELLEPELGVDFVYEVYEQNRLGYSGIGAVNRALNVLGAGVTFDDVFKQFAVANWTKDLTGVPNDSYNYVDEDEVGNPGPYGPVSPNPGGTISVATPAAEWNNQWTDRYGIRYFEADIGSPCPVISVSFGHDSGPAFYHIVTQNGTVFNTHMQRSGSDWNQAFLNDGVTKVVAIAGSLGSSSQVDIALDCANPVLKIKMPNSGAVARTQSGDKFLVQVAVTDGSGGPVVSGLGNSDFAATVDDKNAPVVGGGFVQEQYWLLLEAPNRPDGTYDLAVTLETTPAASDVSAGSVLYTEDLTDQVLVIDRSGSMGADDRLVAAQDAASFYVDVTRNNDGLAVVPYESAVNPPAFDMAKVNETVRGNAKIFINSLGAGGMTSIGAGLEEAVLQRAGSPTGNPLCSFVLLSDGMENTYPFWSDVEGAVLETGCPVTMIAFGPESDETLMQEIATATGGLYFYNDVYDSSKTTGVRAFSTMADADLALANTYEYAEGVGEGRQRLLAEKGVLTDAMPEAKHEVYVDDTLSEAVFSLDWYAGLYPEPGYDNMELELVDPSGDSFNAIIPGYSFEDLLSKHVGFRLGGEDLELGTWALYVRLVEPQSEALPYQVTVSGQTWITLHLLLPDRMGFRYTTGQSVPIYAILAAHGPITDAQVEAIVTAPDGTETHLMLADDGQHGDGMPSDGLYAGLYTLVTQADVVEPAGEEPLGDAFDAAVSPQGEEAEIEVKDEGGYRVLVLATDGKFTREAMGGFSVLEGADVEPADRIPDVWEKENGVTDAGGDPDGDGLTNYWEYMNGTDPHDPDTDDGGENDGSEVAGGRNPLDPADDEIRAPSFFHVRPVLHRSVGMPNLVPAVRLEYDWRTEYYQMWWYRATSPDGPWGEPSGRLGSSGYFTDTTVAAGTTYWYLFEATVEVVRAEPAASTVLISEGVIPAEDPYPPEALVLINGGAPSTKNPFVTLSFVPYEMEGDNPDEVFEDIKWMKISNDPSFDGVDWEPFDPDEDVPWLLGARHEGIATVYALFRDDADNESIAPEVGVILYVPEAIYLPIVLRAY